jgi:two-component system response regulator FixJ
MAVQPVIFIVDDDAGIRDFIRVLLEFAGFPNVKTYESSRRFLQEAALQDGDCVLLDLHMPELNGLEVQRELNRRWKRLGVIMVTGHADVPTAVKAMQAGAVDFIEKPFSNDVLIASVHRALAVNRDDGGPPKSEAALRRLNALTVREREVFERIIKGWPNKTVARDLKISQRTVEMHRARIMGKMQAQNLANLIRMAIDAGIPLGPGRK